MNDFVFEDIAVGASRRNVSLGLFATKSVFTKGCIGIYDTEAYGRCMYIDDSLQLSEKHEVMYHESLAHIAMMQTQNVKRVLIIGGGDGGTLREVLKYKSKRALEKVVLCEINQDVCEASVLHLPFTGMTESLKSGIVDVEYQDGADYIEECEKFDVILVDCGDPVGDASVLYTDEFLRKCHAKLNPDGVFGIQGSNVYVQEDFVRQLRYSLSRLFKYTQYAYVPMPSYPTGGIGFYFARDLPIEHKQPDVEVHYCDATNMQASFLMRPPSFTRNRRSDAFVRYCEKFYDWRKHLNDEELSYVEKCFEFEGEPFQNSMFACAAARTHVCLHNSPCTIHGLRMGSWHHGEKLQGYIEAVLRSRKIDSKEPIHAFEWLNVDDGEPSASTITLTTQKDVKNCYPGFSAFLEDGNYFDECLLRCAYLEGEEQLSLDVFDLSGRYTISEFGYFARATRLSQSTLIDGSFEKVLEDVYRAGLRPVLGRWVSRNNHQFEVELSCRIS